jgi:hypothetical protein
MVLIPYSLFPVRWSLVPDPWYPPPSTPGGYKFPLQPCRLFFKLHGINAC